MMQFSCFTVSDLPMKNSLMVTQRSGRKLKMDVEDVDDETVHPSMAPCGTHRVPNSFYTLARLTFITSFQVSFLFSSLVS